mmetsp:Transcript_32537/g.52333  ORF Transcript_32537/g.52333 Transcript_32537/m.52333 type:complete len:524 (+) Transcript_32537:124-1695(+)
MSYVDGASPEMLSRIPGRQRLRSTTFLRPLRLARRGCACFAAAVAATASIAVAFAAPLVRMQSSSRAAARDGIQGRGRQVLLRADPSASGALSFDFVAWLQSFQPGLGTFWDRYTTELAGSLAAWTAPIVGLAILVILVGLSSNKQRDDFGFEEEDLGSGMGLMLGKTKQKLQIRSLNRQFDGLSQSMARATMGAQEARRLKQVREESYVNLQKEELEISRKAGDLGTDTFEPHMQRVWVLNFQNGRNDVTASGVEQLRQEITAVVMSADAARDEVVLRLDSGGGTVTGYGLAGAQLLRLRDAGLKLTVAIDQVAASGGYLMACTASRIICSPFAVIGSIGVIQEIPVVFERLKREGIKFETTTAGKYKRTLTPTKEPTDEDRKKNQEDLQDVLKVFKEFVLTSRPSIDIERVATGETWLGPLAKDQGLVDELLTSDALLLGYIREGRQVLEVTYTKASSSNPLQQAFASAAETVAAALRGPVGVTPGSSPPVMAQTNLNALPWVLGPETTGGRSSAGWDGMP